MRESKNPCCCHVADSLAWAVWRLKYYVDIQSKGSVKTHPSIVDGSRQDFRDTLHYKMLSKIFEPAEVSLQNPDGAICPYLVLIHALANGWPGSEGAGVASNELINVLNQIGPVEGNQLPDILKAALDRLQGYISGRFVPDWLELGKEMGRVVK
jgi:hypothetical protein